MRRKSRKASYKGRDYDSELEVKYAIDLDARLASGKILAWRPQIEFVIQPAYSLDGHVVPALMFTPDFLVDVTESLVHIVECKWTWGRDDLLRWKILGYLFTKLSVSEFLALAGVVRRSGTVAKLIEVNNDLVEGRKARKSLKKKKETPAILPRELPTRMSAKDYQRLFCRGE